MNELTTLTEDETKLLELYRGLPPADRQFALSLFFRLMISGGNFQTPTSQIGCVINYSTCEHAAPNVFTSKGGEPVVK